MAQVFDITETDTATVNTGGSLCWVAFATHHDLRAEVPLEHLCVGVAKPLWTDANVFTGGIDPKDSGELVTHVGLEAWKDTPELNAAIEAARSTITAQSDALNIWIENQLGDYKNLQAFIQDDHSGSWELEGGELKGWAKGEGWLVLPIDFPPAAGRTLASASPVFCDVFPN